MKKIKKHCAQGKVYYEMKDTKQFFFTSSVQTPLIKRIHIRKSHFLFVTGFFMDRSIYFDHATYSFDK